MNIFLGTITTLLLLAISGIHFYWASGGKKGAQAAIPQLKNKLAFEPGRGTTAFVALIFLAFAGVVFSKSVFPISFLPDKWAQVGTSVVAGLFIARAVGDFKYVGFTKKVKDSAFARYDTRFYSPLSLAIGLMALLIVLF